MAKLRLSKTALAYAAGAALVVGGGAVALGPAAPWVIDHFADGQRVWRIGKIKIDGVHGGWLGQLRAEHLSIEDERGVWLEASNVALDWRPQALLGGGVWLHNVHADAMRVLRQPLLEPAKPSAGGGVDVRIDALDIANLTLEQPVVGEAARFRANLQMELRDDALRAIELVLRRADSDADSATVLYRGEGDYAMLVAINGAPGGVFANLLGVPDQSVRIDAVGDGDFQTGGARYEGHIGGAQLLHGTTRWTPAAWSTEGAVQMDLLPGLRPIAERIGASASLSASGARQGAFRAHAQTNFLSIDASGAVDEHYDLDGPAHFVATTRRLSDIARESPFELGAARLEGELRQANGVSAIRAQLDARDLNVLDRRAQMIGPLQASLSAEIFRLTADLRAAADSPPLFANARLQTSLDFNRQRSRFTLARTTLDGDALALDAQGWVNQGDGEFAGQWRVRKLETLTADLRGQAAGRWRAHAEQQRNGDHIWVAAVDGAGANLSGAPDIVPQMLGPAPRLDALFRTENGGVGVDHIRIDGRQLRAAATGRIAHGEANLALEASARGPLTLGAAQIDGAVDATGRLTGRLARPSLTARAALSSFTASGVIVNAPVVDFTLAPAGNAYRGRAQTRGSISGQPFTASANLGIVRDTIAFNDLIAQAGGLEARGNASLAPRGLTAQLALNGAIDNLIPGASGRLTGTAALTPQTITLDAQLADARAGDLRIRAAAIHAAGPYRAIEARFDMRGALKRAPLSFTGVALVSAANGATDVQIQGQGALAGANIATRTPLTLHQADGVLDGALDIAIADGALRGEWREHGRALTGSATLQNAPIAPLAAIFDERATGRIDGRVTLANQGAGLSGNGDLTFRDARFAGRQRGTLNLHVVGNLDPDRLRASIDAQSSDGLVARFEADAPVTTSAAPLRIAMARERRGHATWSIHGPAETLWAAARLQDQALSGQVNGEGALDFGAGYLSGAGQLEIVDGRFEDKLTGIVLTDLDARLSIGERGVNIESFTATSPRGGRLTATGGSADPSQGEITINVDDMWVANRPDARARASGQLTLAWQGLTSNVTGNLALAQADISIAQNPEAGIPTLDVVEINRPGDEDFLDDEPAAPSARAAATRLSVRVTAPGRVFTRGRGVDAEWSLSLRLAGDAAAPRVFGEANIVRGRLALSGQPFEIERGRIAFNGDPLNAELDIAATRDTADLTANILITGFANDPDIALTSTPALPEDEILPQVLFGRSVEDLSPLEAAQIAAALASLSGRASFDLVDAARAAAGLDRFNVRQDDAGGLLVAGGVYLTRDVYVEVARNGLGQAATSVEWTVRPQLVLITSFLGNGDQRVSLRWRRERN